MPLVHNWLMDRIGGDDYLIVDESDVDITKEIMDECNFPYEEVSELPYSLRGYVL